MYNSENGAFNIGKQIWITSPYLETLILNVKYSTSHTNFIRVIMHGDKTVTRGKNPVRNNLHTLSQRVYTDCLWMKRQCYHEFKADKHMERNTKKINKHRQERMETTGDNKRENRVIHKWKRKQWNKETERKSEAKTDEKENWRAFERRYMDRTKQFFFFFFCTEWNEHYWRELLDKPASASP